MFTGQALSNGTHKSRKGISRVTKVHEYFGDIRGKGAYFKVTSVAGHVYSRDFPKQYQNWESVEPYNLFDAETISTISNKEQRIVPHLIREAQNCDFLILWLDNDREGENICFEVWDTVKNALRRDARVLRAKFSSITKPDLQAAFRSLNQGPNENESMSVDARQIIDLKIGVAFSRFQTLHFTRVFPDLNNKLISYGPCQTPTLGFCVARHDEIQSFRPRLYYSFALSLLTRGGAVVNAQFDGGRLYNDVHAQQLLKEFQLAPEAYVEDLKSEEATKPRPAGLNTVSLLKTCSSALGIGPQQTMHIAERLYLQGFLSYPRTESTQYPANFDFNSIVHNLKAFYHPSIASYACKLEVKSPNAGVDMGDHPPITPTINIPHALSGDDYRVYDYVVRYFLGTISSDCTYTKTNATLRVQEHIFRTSGKLRDGARASEKPIEPSRSARFKVWFQSEFKMTRAVSSNSQ